MLIKSKTKVDKLTERVEDFYNQKERDEKKHERYQSRLKQIREAPKWVKTDFWCNRHGDTTGIAVKVVFGREPCAYYESIGSNICREDMTCCKGLRRRITDKQWDNYYRDSKMLERQRKEAIERGDLLQPNDWKFDTKYPQHKRKIWERMEKEDRANFKKKIGINV